tara:strand:- start:8693 stop:8908 length:216 start_codon:yes stop_codon:yes gene_type:complete
LFEILEGSLIFKSLLLEPLWLFLILMEFGVEFTKQKFGEIEIGRFICGNQAVVDRRCHGVVLVTNGIGCDS